MSIRASLELVTLAEMDKPLKRDAAVYSDDIRFCDANRVQYYLCANTWLFVTKRYTLLGFTELRKLILTEGLIGAIKRWEGYAQTLIDGDEVSEQPFKAIYADLCRRWEIITAQQPEGISGSPYRAFLQMLRFPKRFTPLFATKIEKETRNSFLATDNRNKLRQRKELSPFITDLVKHEVYQMLNWDCVCSGIERILSDPAYRKLTPGVARDAGATVGSKLVQLSRTAPEFFPTIMGIPWSGAYFRGNDIYWGVNDEIQRISLVRFVPKSYKSYRTIAMEDVARQTVARAVMDVIDHFMPNQANIHDQERNAHLARLASIDCLLATIDMSSASDTILKTMLWDFFPRKFARLVYPLLPTHYELDGKVRLCHMLSTSGNALTFVLETIVFLAVNRAAHNLARRHGVSYPDDYSEAVPSVFGDDQVVWACDYEVTRDMLEALGFIVNDAKSYSSLNPYRESCGTDAYLGEDVSSTYWPRRIIRGKVEKGCLKIYEADRIVDQFHADYGTSLSSMISLQHRLFNETYEGALFLAEVCQETGLKLTTSEPGSETTDLWGYVESHTKRLAPGAAPIVGRNPHALDEAQFAVYGRTAHSAMITEYPRGDRAEWKERLYDLYRYQNFLLHGPRYADPLLESLGISEPPASYEQAFVAPVIRWTKTVDA